MVKYERYKKNKIIKDAEELQLKKDLDILKPKIEKGLLESTRLMKSYAENFINGKPIAPELESMISMIKKYWWTYNNELETFHYRKLYGTDKDLAELFFEQREDKAQDFVALTLLLSGSTRLVVINDKFAAISDSSETSRALKEHARQIPFETNPQPFLTPNNFNDELSKISEGYESDLLPITRAVSQCYNIGIQYRNYNMKEIAKKIMTDQNEDLAKNYLSKKPFDMLSYDYINLCCRFFTYENDPYRGQYTSKSLRGNFSCVDVQQTYDLK